MESDTPFAITVEGGAKLSPDVAVYTDVWVQPTVHTAGADIGIRLRQNLDLFAGGWSDFSGSFGATAGVKLRF